MKKLGTMIMVALLAAGCESVIQGDRVASVCDTFNGDFVWSPGEDAYCTRGPLGWLWKRENLPQPAPSS